eukprot:1467257-Prorocentrum_lima.AAC.1
MQRAPLLVHITLPFHLPPRLLHMRSPRCSNRNAHMHAHSAGKGVLLTLPVCLDLRVAPSS